MNETICLSMFYFLMISLNIMSRAFYSMSQQPVESHFRERERTTTVLHRVVSDGIGGGPMGLDIYWRALGDLVEVLIILGPTFGSRNVHGPTPTDTLKGDLCLPQFIIYVPFFKVHGKHLNCRVG